MIKSKLYMDMQRIKEYYKKIDGKYFIVEDVPCFVCDYCGEKSFNLKTLEKIETIIEGITEAKKANIITYSVAA